jgi:uncharacterized membrane protein
MSNKINYFAALKAGGTLIGTIVFTFLFVLGNIYFEKALWIFIGLSLVTCVAITVAVAVFKYWYKCYHPNWHYGMYDANSTNYKWTYKG